MKPKQRKPKSICSKLAQEFQPERSQKPIKTRDKIAEQIAAKVFKKLR